MGGFLYLMVLNDKVLHVSGIIPWVYYFADREDILH